jgi:two-component system chemotaxis response regulator CheY
MKVLVVDDSQLMHHMFEIALRTHSSSHIETHFATNGREGLDALNAHPDVAIVFLDINMPQMSGLEFLERVRREAAFDTVRIVLQSTEDQEADIQRGLQAGAVAYLTKPFSPEQLHALLDELVSAPNVTV